MRVVIDSNRVQTPELTKFLAAMPCNPLTWTPWALGHNGSPQTLLLTLASCGFGRVVQPYCQRFAMGA